jgi:hypothetical protein
MAFNHQSTGWMSIEWQYVLIHKLIGFWEVLVTVSVFRTISDKSRDIMFPWAIWCEYPDAECFIDRLFVKVRIEGIDFFDLCTEWRWASGTNSYAKQHIFFIWNTTYWRFLLLLCFVHLYKTCTRKIHWCALQLSTEFSFRHLFRRKMTL